VRGTEAFVNREFVDGLLSVLADAGDPERALKQQAYMKSVLPYYGISMPDLRRITTTVMREYTFDGAEQLEATVRFVWDNVTHREQWYAALTLLGAKQFSAFRNLEFLDLYEHLIITGAWWDVVDDVATHFVGPLLRAEPEVMTQVLRQWAADDHLWLQRSAIIAQVGAGTETDTELLRQVIEPSLERREFFLRKAIGWALRDYARTEPEWVRTFVAEHDDRLSPLSKKEATKHLV